MIVMRHKRFYVCLVCFVVCFTLACNSLWNSRINDGSSTVRSNVDSTRFIKEYVTKRPNENTFENAELVPSSIGNVNYEEVMQRRVERVNEQCRLLSNASYMKSVKPHGTYWHYENMDYCGVPKVGCTYWKRVMKFISHDYPSDPDIIKPSDIDRHFAHGGKRRKIRQLNVLDYAKNIQQDAGNKTSISFMFIRDPYTRLWSNYLDKFFLPDFWNMGKYMLDASQQNMTSEQRLCGNSLTFTGFLTAITNIWPKKLNVHWEPAHLICGPCHVKYDVIGQMEHFADDSKYILEKFGIGHLREIASKRDLAFVEIETLTKYNFELLTRKKIVGRCITIMEMAKRLWKTFQYNGYIDKLVSFPTDKFHGHKTIEESADTFIKIAEMVIDQQDQSFSSQKREMMLEAYREVPKDILEKLNDIYKYDFEIFGYDKDLFK